MAEWKRLHIVPRRLRLMATLEGNTAKERYYYWQSRERYMRRDDAAEDGGLLTGQIGRIEGVRFIT